jgi:hypothetical protein
LVGGKRMEYRILMGKLLGKQPLERSGKRWENITLDVIVIACEDVTLSFVMQEKVI